MASGHVYYFIDHGQIRKVLSNLMTILTLNGTVNLSFTASQLPSKKNNAQLNIYYILLYIIIYYDNLVFATVLNCGD